MTTAPPPGPEKLYLPVMKLASVMFRVEATSPPTFTWAFGPNRMPLGLTRNTLPLADRLPKIADGSGPVTRFRATELLFGWANRTDSLGAMLKLCQLITAFWLVWLTVSARPPPERLAEPAATWPPVGRA